MVSVQCTLWHHVVANILGQLSDSETVAGEDLVQVDLSQTLSPRPKLQLQEHRTP